MVEAMDKKVVTKSGLFAHGRGEAFDYMLGERTMKPAMDAIEAAVALILTAKHPVISVNGNTAALVSGPIVDLAKATGAKIEVNLFYREPGREEAVAEMLREAGAEEILGLGDVEPATLPGIDSDRRIIDPRGIAIADVVIVPLEDGDRTEALRKAGKKIIAIDLNPMSRTSQFAHVTICDNIIRCVPKMAELATAFKASKSSEQLQDIVQKFSNKKVLSKTIKEISKYLGKLAKKGTYLEIPEEITEEQ
jgi:4-phosphopantoate--beta-alanine ligase